MIKIIKSKKIILSLFLLIAAQTPIHAQNIKLQSIIKFIKSIGYKTKFQPKIDIPIILLTPFLAALTNELYKFYEEKINYEDTNGERYNKKKKVNFIDKWIYKVAGATTISLLAINTIYCAKAILGAMKNLGITQNNDLI